MSDPSSTPPTYGTVPANPNGTPTPSTAGVPPVPPVPPSTPPSFPPATPVSSTGAGTHDTGNDSGGKVDEAKAKAGEAASTAKDEAASVLGDASSSASAVAGTAKDEAAKVASVGKDQAAALLGEATENLRSQSSVGKDRAAVGLRGVSDELASLANGDGGQGMVADLARQAGTRLGGVAEWLDGRDVDGVLRDVQTFARRKPMTFIAIAVGAGVVAGRLTRALKDAPASSPSASTSGAPAAGAPGVGRHSVMGGAAQESTTNVPSGTDPIGAVDSAQIEEYAWGTPSATEPGRTERA